MDSLCFAGSEKVNCLRRTLLGVPRVGCQLSAWLRSSRAAGLNVVPYVVACSPRTCCFSARTFKKYSISVIIKKIYLASIFCFLSFFFFPFRSTSDVSLEPRLTRSTVDVFIPFLPNAVTGNLMLKGFAYACLLSLFSPHPNIRIFFWQEGTYQLQSGVFNALPTDLSTFHPTRSKSFCRTSYYISIRPMW